LKTTLFPSLVTQDGIGGIDDEGEEEEVSEGRRRKAAVAI